MLSFTLFGEFSISAEALNERRRSDLFLFSTNPSHTLFLRLYPFLPFPNPYPVEKREKMLDSFAILIGEEEEEGFILGTPPWLD